MRLSKTQKTQGIHFIAPDGDVRRIAAVIARILIGLPIGHAKLRGEVSRAEKE